MALVAVVREPSASLAECELSYVERSSIDLKAARAQHAGYCAALRAAGLEVRVLPALDHLPDAAFVEDTAVVLDEVAVLGALGAESRALEAEAIAAVLETYRPVRRLDRPGATLEGGDVLRIGRTVYVGRSRRTNAAGIEAFWSVLDPLGYRLRVVPVEGCLHLKTACSSAGRGIVVLNPSWVSGEPFEQEGLTVVPVASREPWAANVLEAAGTLLLPAGNRGTATRLRAAGLDPVDVEIGEFQKAEAGLTCMSLLIPA
ncbi:MAG TPA: arginine deiminase family protein [Gemmatimonadales bacterium]|nr:arginine deiminase family protein [Gemmatimonadales bacterium]